MLPNPKLWGTLAVIVIVVAAFAIYRQARSSTPQRPPTHEWFYDLNTGKIFSAPADQVPPIAAPSGATKDGQPAGVRARVLSCGKCTESQQFVAYLETYTPEDRERLLRLQNPTIPTEKPAVIPEMQAAADPLAGGRSLVRRPTDSDWVSMQSREGAQIVREADQKCGAGKRSRMCLPQN